MFEEFDYDTLLDRMLSNVSDDLDKREGSIIYDAVAPAALELANFYIALDMVMDEVFADSASYYYLIKRAAERGIYPKEETHAICKMEVLPVNTPISLGDRFNLGDLNYTVTSVVDTTTGTYQLECETAGIVGNQQLGDLLVIETEKDTNNMQSAKITEILIPGEEEEDVEAFRERYFSSFSSEAFGGNKQDYREKINDMDGVGGSKTIRSWEKGYNPASMIPTEAVQTWFEQQSEETVGSEVYSWLSKIYNAAKEKLLTTGGTVKSYIITSEFKEPSSTLVEMVQNRIDPTNKAGEGDGLAPIGHVVDIQGVREMPIKVSFSITYKEGYSFDVLKESIEQTIDSYFLELAETWASNEHLIVRISQVEARVLLLEGILDISETKINDTSENITLEIDEIPIRSDVSG